MNTKSTTLNNPLSTTLSAAHPWNAYIHQRKPGWNAIALTYTLGAYGGGIALLIANFWAFNVVGVILTTHALVLAAYWSHEFMHGTIFNTMRTNYRWGAVMQWINGTSYVGFKEFAQAHIDHHIDGVDYFGFDRVEFVERLPKVLQSAIATLEWCYFPALFLIRQWAGIVLLFQQAKSGQERLWVISVLLIRFTLFVGLAIASLKALLLYFLCYIGMVHTILLMDCLQHTYEVHLLGVVVPRKSVEYEQANTFSTPLSRRFPWLNLLLLNFSYHNAHHAVMKCPWYNLPALDREVSQQQTVHYVSLKQVFANYHRFRVFRVFSTDEGRISLDEAGNLKFDEFYGVAGGTSILLA